MEGRGKVYNLLVNLTRCIQRDKTAICGKGHPSDSSGSDPADSLLLLKGGGGGGGCRVHARVGSRFSLE